MSKFDTERKAKLNATQWAPLHEVAIAKNGDEPEFFWFYSIDVVPSYLVVISIRKNGKWKEAK